MCGQISKKINNKIVDKSSVIEDKFDRSPYHENM